MKIPLLILLIGALVCTAGCSDRPESDQEAVEATDLNPSVLSSTVNIESDDLTYPAYLAAPMQGEGEMARYPGIVMLHSINGLEPGYLDLADQLASFGFVVIAPEWQTFERSPRDDVVGGIVNSSVEHLMSREDVDSEKLGLTGFCIGGRYTMLFLPTMNEFSSGVAWYGFPYSGGFNNETRPFELIEELHAPMLIIHGTRDAASPVSEIYQYATALDAADKYFEMKIYYGEPHGFMIEEGERSESFAAQDALMEMTRFFERTLKG